MQGDVRSESAHVRQRHTTPHLAGELFKFMAGVDTVDVDLIIGRPPESDAKFLNDFSRARAQGLDSFLGPDRGEMVE